MMVTNNNLCTQLLELNYVYLITAFCTTGVFRVSLAMPTNMSQTGNFVGTALIDTTLSSSTTTNPRFSSVNPVVGRVIWCINEKRQMWAEKVNIGLGPKELQLVQSGKFRCPQPNQTAEMKYCCGQNGEQYCCRLQDTPGLKWGIAVGVVVTLIVFLTVSYTIQVFRTCDRCYHECPIFGFNSRWYTVSHEGNRYGVTFHSRLFANEFMKCLEAAYGRWNTANMLKIQRDGQDFVILNIFFHDLFTPWFYTQGPIKNDEEWIRSDFKNICLTVQARLQVTLWNQLHQLVRCCKKPPDSRDEQNSNGNRETVESICLEQLNQCKPTTTVESPDNRGYRKWVPWTKATIGLPAVTNLAGQKLLSRTSTRRKYGRKSDKSETTQFVKLLIFEDIIECNGLDKGIQTGQKEVWTKRIDNTTSINVSHVNV